MISYLSCLMKKINLIILLTKIAEKLYTSGYSNIESNAKTLYSPITKVIKDFNSFISIIKDEIKQ